MQAIVAYILAKTAAISSANAYTDNKVAAIVPGFNFKGSVPTVEDLASKEKVKGDLYNIQTGGCYACDGTNWYPATLKGEDGFSPIANVSKSGNTTTITIQDKTGTTTAIVQDGFTWKPSVSSDGDISWTVSSDTTAPTIQNIRGPKGERGERGEKGDKGDPGSYSAGSAIDITNDIIAVKFDNTTLKLNNNNLTLSDNIITQISSISEKADKLEILHVSAYGFDTNLRVNQQIEGSELVDKVISATNVDKKQVIVKSGSYKYNVTSILDDTGFTGLRGFAVTTLFIPVSSLSDKPALEKCLFLYNPQENKTFTFYDKDFNSGEISQYLATISSAIGALSSAIELKQNKLTAGSNINITGNAIAVVSDGFTINSGIVKKTASQTDGAENLYFEITNPSTSVVENVSLAYLLSTRQVKLTQGENITINEDTGVISAKSYDNEVSALSSAVTSVGEKVDTKQTKLIAGENITILNPTMAVYPGAPRLTGNAAQPIISAIDTKYTAGKAIAIDSSDNNKISVAYDTATLSINSDGLLYVTKEGINYSAGSNIEISTDNKISVSSAFENRVSAVESGLSAKQDTLSATAPISINNNKVELAYESASLSVRDGKLYVNKEGIAYQAGNEIDITNNVISVKDNFIARMSGAENNISTLSSSVSGISTALSSEVTRATAAESALQSAIDNKQSKLSAGSAIDLTGDVVAVKFDNKTIKLNSGKLETAVGGYIEHEPEQIVAVNTSVSEKTGDYELRFDADQSTVSFVKQHYDWETYTRLQAYVNGTFTFEDSSTLQLTNELAGFTLDSESGELVGQLLINPHLLGSDQLSLTSSGKSLYISFKPEKQVASGNVNVTFFDTFITDLVHYINSDFIHIDNKTIVKDAYGKLSADTIPYKSFPSDFVTTGTLEQLVDSMVASSSAKKGRVFVGELERPCLPAGLENAECKVEYIEDNVVILTLSSADTAPYKWEYNSYQSWKPDYTWRKWSEVIANPSVEATESLNKISIDGTAYNLSGSSYTAGEAIAISTDNKINVAYDSATLSVVENKLKVIGGGGSYTAGTGIAISSDNVISVDNVPANKVVYTKATTVVTTIGGLKAGLNLQGRTLENIIERLVGAYTPPSFTSSSFGGSAVIINQRTGTESGFIMGDTAQLNSYTITLSKGTDFNSLNTVIIKQGNQTIKTLTQEEMNTLSNTGTVTIQFSDITQTLPAQSTSGSWTVSATANYGKKSYDANENIVINNVDMSAGSKTISAADQQTFTKLYYGIIPADKTVESLSPDGIATYDGGTSQFTLKSSLGEIQLIPTDEKRNKVIISGQELTSIKFMTNEDIQNWTKVTKQFSYTRVNGTVYTKTYYVYYQAEAVGSFTYILQ